ncbi:MAG: hypothetical protein IIW08_06330, partial [Clostridia bacterium]|nr:hypothetical protein [Clostridia bacterium]
FVRIYPTVVIKETELYKLYKSGQYVPYSLDKAVDVCSKLLNMFEDNGIKKQKRTGITPCRKKASP